MRNKLNAKKGTIAFKVMELMSDKGTRTMTTISKEVDESPSSVSSIVRKLFLSGHLREIGPVGPRDGMGYRLNGTNKP